MRFVYGYFTHRGHVRQHNEDCLFVPEPGESRHTGLTIVADGMGGYNAGDVASRTAVQYIQEHFDAGEANNLPNNEAISTYLINLIEGANKQVFTMAASDSGLAGMGTTLTFAWINGREAYIAHVGDSRCYLIREGRVSQITKDHSLVQQLVDAGQIRESDMYVHPQKNIITKAVGTDGDVAPDIVMAPVKPGDILLLCTDGFINHVNLKDYASRFDGTRSLMDLAEVLGQKALDGGGEDNITLVLAQMLPDEGRVD